jgi:hypothetical protein
MQNYEAEYLKKLSGLVMITGSNSYCSKLLKHLTNSPEMSNANLKFVMQESLDLPKVDVKEPFLSRAFNHDKAAAFSIRFGILPMQWVGKYVHKKPATLVFMINIADISLHVMLDNLDAIYAQIEEFIRKNKIKLIFVLLSKSVRNEEEKNVLKAKYELCNKIITGHSDRPDEIYKDIEAVIKSYSKKFYQTKIAKYKENLAVGNPEQIRFQEFYLRNLLKISFMFVFNNEYPKAAKYFERAHSVAIKVQEQFCKICEASISKQDDSLSRFYFYIQKNEEANRLSNLSKLWVLMIKLRDRDVTIMEAFRSLHQQTIELERYKFWHLTPTPHFEVLSKIHLFRCFLIILGEKLVKLPDLLVKIQILSLTKNLLSVILYFVSQMKQKSHLDVKSSPNYFGLVLMKESNLVDSSELVSLNQQSMSVYSAFEENLAELPELLDELTATINRCYDDSVKRLVNVNFLQVARVQSVCTGISFSEIYANFILIDVFQNFGTSKKTAIEYIKNDCYEKHQNIVLKEMIDYDKFDKEEFDSVLKKASKADSIIVSLGNQSFFIDSVFRDQTIENFEPIHLNLKIKTSRKFLRPYLNKVSLIFSHPDFNTDISLGPDNLSTDTEYLYLTIKDELRSRDPCIELSSLSLTALYLICDESVFFYFDKKMPVVEKSINKLTIHPVQAISLETDFGKEVILNNQFLPLNLHIKKNIKNYQDFVFKSLEMKIKPFVSKETVRSVKLYKEARNSGDDNIKVSEDKDSQLILLSTEKQMRNESFTIAEEFQGAELSENYFLKIKLTQDAEIELEILISAMICPVGSELTFEKFFSFKRKVVLKCAFSISKTIQTLGGRSIRRLDEKENEMRIELDTKQFINFYLKSNVNQIEINAFEFIPSEVTTLIEYTNTLESPLALESLEGVNNGIIFTINRICSNKNMGNLRIVWRKVGDSYLSKTTFKNLLIVESYDLPFDVHLQSSVKVNYCDFFTTKVVIKNKSPEEKKMTFLLGGAENVLAAGMVNKQFTLIPKEQREISISMMCTKTGIVKLPEFQLFIHGKTSADTVKYMVKLPKNVFVEYRRDD